MIKTGIKKFIQIEYEFGRIGILFQISNPFATALRKLRFWRLQKLWATKIPNILNLMEQNKEIEYYDFKWTQLVTQEIRAWIISGQKVSLIEFTDICIRRGFYEEMSRTLEELLRHCGLAGWEKEALSSPMQWNPYNKVVQDHRDGTIDHSLTNLARKKRGLRTPWTPEIGEEEVRWKPVL